MFLTAALLAMSLPQAVPMALNDAKNSEPNTEVTKVEIVKEDAREGTVLPSAPTPKTASEVAESSSLNPAAIRPAEPIKPANGPKFVARGYDETRGQRIAWLGLAAAGHGAAAFDAYSTRQAIAGGYGTEANPMLRPFAHSGALYVATQVSPTLMDFVGHKMMRSRQPLLRKMWWLPQAAGAGISFSAAMHNRSLVK
ncbi:MAG: hypothetical protein NVS9B14_20080 [Candidatus Acidiferrum sp.]